MYVIQELTGISDCAYNGATQIVSVCFRKTVFFYIYLNGVSEISIFYKERITYTCEQVNWKV